MINTKRFSHLALASVLAAGLLVQLVPLQTVNAAPIGTRKLTLEANGTTGGSAPGGVVRHRFTVSPGTSASIQSVRFQYCTSATGTCTTPTGLSTPTSVTLTNETGTSGFSANATTLSTNGSPYITNSSAAAFTSGTPVSFQLTGITNPTAANYTFFVRISTYSSADTTGTAVDTGTVAASTANQLLLSGEMPESLVFCTGQTVTAVGTVPDCSTATDSTIDFPEFSPITTSFATSQMAASTNAGDGYVITANGATMTSGSNTIASMATNAASAPGNAQFGFNLVDNTTPNVGADVDEPTNGTQYNGRAHNGTLPNLDYHLTDSFAFRNGDTVADSTGDGTDGQIFTTSYIVNVPGNQPAGTYQTTMTYICTPTF